MRKPVKLLAYTGFALLGVFLLAALLHPFYLGAGIRKAVSTIGPTVTKTSVSLEKVTLNLFTGKLLLKGLVVGNPEGYKTEAAIKVGEVRVSLSPMSVFSSKIHVKEVYIDGAEAWYEAGFPDSNVGKIQKNVDAFLGGAGKPAEPATPAQTAPEKAGKKVVIDDLRIVNTKVHLGIKGLGGAAAPIPMPDIKQKDLGKEGDGKTIGQMVADILKSITGGISDAATGAGKAVAGAAKEVGKSLGEAGKGAVDAVKGLFGGSK